MKTQGCLHTEFDQAMQISHGTTTEGLTQTSNAKRHLLGMLPPY